MTNKFNFFLGVAWLFSITVANAQVAAGTEATVKGTPYLSENYEEGVIAYANNNFKVPVRYNVFKDVIEYQQNGQLMALDPSAKIKKVSVSKSTFVVEKYVLDGKPKFGYFVLLDSGKVKLYAKKVVSYLAAKKGGALDGSDQPAEFRKAPDAFYYKIGDGNLQEVKNIKSMIASFPDKQDELTQFAKKEKISPRDEEELVQLVKHYNSL